MKTLTYEKDVNGFLQPTAKVTLKTGREIWVGNPVAELAEAMDDDTPFLAHATVGMQARDLILNPAHVAAIEATV